MRPGGERMPALAQGQRRDAEASREEQPASGYRLASARPVRGAGRMLCCTRPQHNVRARLMGSAPTWSNSASWLALGRGRLQDMLRDHAVIRTSP